MENKVVINNEYDFSNKVPLIEYINYLVNYCNQQFKELERLIKDDEEKNKMLKDDYRTYNYKKNYGSSFEVRITENNCNTIYCKDIEMFTSAVNSGNVKNICKLVIDLNLDFDRGKIGNIEKHENSFKIHFSPYDIKFKRNSNYSDNTMDLIEKEIKEILDKFPTVNCIFCTKEG